MTHPETTNIIYTKIIADFPYKQQTRNVNNQTTLVTHLIKIITHLTHFCKNRETTNRMTSLRT